MARRPWGLARSPRRAPAPQAPAMATPASLEDLKCRLAAIRREERTTSQKHRRAQRVPAAIRAAAEMLTLMVDDDSVCACHFLKRRAAADMNVDRQSEALRLWRRGMSGDQAAQKLARPWSKRDAAAAEVATKYLREYALHGWVREQNLARGAAPMTSTLWSLAMGKSSVEPAAGLLSPRAGLTRGRRQWLRRWRRRWQVRLGRIPARDILPVDVRRRKATARSTHPEFHKVGSGFAVRGSEKGAGIWTPKCSPASHNRKDMGSKRRSRFPPRFSSICEPLRPPDPILEPAPQIVTRRRRSGAGCSC